MKDIRDSMAARLQYRGGNRTQDRMIAGKLNSLKKALIRSYQGATAVLDNGEKFRCLINPNKLTRDYDRKILSIPFEDIMLNDRPEDVGMDGWERPDKTSNGMQNIVPTKLDEGTVFHWEETNTDWLVYLRAYDELAYFRAEIERCRYEVEIGGKPYKVYIKGPVETSLVWQEQSKKTWNDMNYSLQMDITLDENTEQYLHRFAIVRFKNKNWQVSAVDNVSTPGIINVYLEEYFSNEIKDAREQEIAEIKELEQEQPIPEIQGAVEVYPYDVKEYGINRTGGVWSVSNKKARIISSTDTAAEVEIVTGKSGDFELIYTIGEEVISLPIKIKSL